MPHFGDKIHSTLILNPYLVLILGNLASIIPKMLLALNQSIELILEIQSRVIPLSHQILNYNNTKLCYSGITHRSKLTHSFSNVWLYFFFLSTNLSLWNFRVCTISGLFCRKFHKCILSSEQTETRAPYKTQEIKSSIIPKQLNQQAYNSSNKMSSLFIIITFFFFPRYDTKMKAWTHCIIFDMKIL